MIGARVRDVLQKKQQDVYARQVSLAQALCTVQSIRSREGVCKSRNACLK